ncbi:MAG: 2-hydroxyglutaryl-CoA dehydratase [Candidatus Cloacimonetes bacterium]|nr:2-hydroxyglutaryl-CoA dehydratase [Candidatus Cloacimonadota bacterium]
MITAGIDIGSRNTKIIFWDTDLAKMVCKKVVTTGTEPQRTAQKLLADSLVSLNIHDKNIPFNSTGYGRKLINSDHISEISCHARGIRQLIPTTMTIIDIGGQDSKVISLDREHHIIEFAMNDKCAAGTGSFLERISELFNVPLSSLGELALQSQENVDISSTCVVFAESEIISLINRNTSQNDILMGIHRSIAKRVKNLLSNIQWQPPVTLTGGVALNLGVQKALEDELQTKISVPDEPIFSGALGAAFFAANLE